MRRSPRTGRRSSISRTSSTRAIGPRRTATTTSRRVNRGPIASRSPPTCEDAAKALIGASLLGQTGNPGNKECCKHVARDLVDIEIVARPSHEIDLVVGIAQLDDRQQHVETIGEADGHAILGPLSGEAQNDGAKNDQNNGPSHRELDVMTVADGPVERREPGVPETRRLAALALPAVVADGPGVVGVALVLKGQGKLLVSVWREGFLFSKPAPEQTGWALRRPAMVHGDVATQCLISESADIDVGWPRVRQHRDRFSPCISQDERFAWAPLR